MTRWERLITVVGGLFVLLAVGQAILGIVAGKPTPAILVDFVVVAVPGVLILYGVHRLRRGGVSAELHPRIAGWCLGGIGVMLGIVVLLVLNPAGSVDRPLRAGWIAAAIGGVGGFAIGLQEARAITRARQAERARVTAQLADQRAQHLDEFTAIVSHDLRGPLRQISSYLTLLEQRYQDDLDEDAREFIQHAVEGADQTRRTLDNLLTLARQGKFVDEPTSVPLQVVIDDAWEMVDSPEADLEVHAGETVIMADCDRLQQLLENLFRNAVEHGGPDVRVRVGRLSDGFYVEDDGPGIPADRRDRVFEAGFTTSDDGTGFGLSIVHRVAEAHDWEVTVTDAPSHGTRVEISGVGVREADGGRPAVVRDSAWSNPN